MLKPLAAAALFLLAAGATAPKAAEPAGCNPDGGLAYICGIGAPEDLAIVPGASLLVAGSLVREGRGGGLHLVDSKARTWWQIYPTPEALWRPDEKRFPVCQAPPPIRGFSTHGLAIRGTGPGLAEVYVVAHGARESIEVFTLDTRGPAPVIAWVGCVPMPEGLAANSVAVFEDGTILATILYRNGTTPVDSFAGRPTGVVLQWRPGTEAFVAIPGTELPSNNGIEVSADGQRFFVVSTGLKQLVEFSRADPSRPLRRAQIVGFTPDNVHRMADGSLLLGGMDDDEPECGGKPAPVNGRMDFSCHRGYRVSAVDPATMAVKVIAEGPRNPSFSGTTAAFRVGDELWLASLMGDRMAYRPWP